MAQQTINIGTTPNDGTGNSIRDSFDKVNDNFTELYSAPVVNTSVTVGNTSTNATLIEPDSITVGNSTVNSTVDTTVIKIANSTSYSSITQGQLVVANTTVVNSSVLTIGSSSVNNVLTSTSITLSNSSTTFAATKARIAVGNSSVNTAIDSSSITTGSANLSSNTLTLGTSSVSGNGFSYLPNGLMMNWGTVDVNSTTGEIRFSNAFPTAVYSVTVTRTSNSTTSGETSYSPSVLSQNTTIAEVRTANANLITVNYIAIGS